MQVFLVFAILVHLFLVLAIACALEDIVKALKGLRQPQAQPHQGRVFHY